MKYKLIESVVTNRDSDNKLNLITLDDDEKVYTFTKAAADIVEELGNKEMSLDEILKFTKEKFPNIDAEENINKLIDALKNNKLVTEN
jgi:hypothetical protein